MKGKDMFLGIEHLDVSFIEEAEFGDFSRKAFYQEERRLPRILLLAAVVALAAALVGCGIVYVLHMQDLKLDDQQITQWRWDTQQETMVREPISHQVLTFSGIKGSPNYQAAREWLDFQRDYDPDYSRWHSGEFTPVENPEAYTGYNLYSQEQARALEAIAQTHGLTLAGKPVEARTPGSLLAYLGIDSLLRPESLGILSNMTAQYHENGLFYADFYLLMEDGWPHDTFCLYYYTPKNCFDDHFVYLAETADWREWNYTTAAGEPVLILRSDSRGEAYLFRDREEATIAIKVYTNHPEESMTDRQLQQLADQFPFSLQPHPGNPAILAGFGAGIDTKSREQEQNGCTLRLKSVATDGELAYITLGVTAPEGTILEGRALHPGNRGEGLLLPQDGRILPNAYSNWITREDGDGLKNTLDLVIIGESSTRDATAFCDGSLWSLYIEGLDISQPNSMLQEDVLGQLVGVWQFDIPFVDGDYREIEFIREPVTILARTGPALYGPVELVSLKLRTYSACATFADIPGDLNDYRSDSCTCAVLQDGSRIRLHDIGGPGNITGFDPERQIPLEEVAYVELHDGTKLFPVD